MNNTASIISRLFSSTIEAPTEGTYQPTLIVGLGGTGIRVLRLLKGYLIQHQLNEIRLLGIDSDLTELSKYPELTPLTEREFFLLDQDPAVRTLAQAAKKMPVAQHVLTYLPETHGGENPHLEVRTKISGQRGAGQYRRSGKLLLCANVSGGRDLNHCIGNIHQDMLGLDKRVEQVARGLAIAPGARIYVVSSIAGGQGAGALIDCLGLLRSHFQAAQDNITAVLLMPGRLYDAALANPSVEKPQTRGNGIGTLRELQAFRTGALANHTFVFDADLRSALNNQALANTVYLVDHTTLSNAKISNLVDLFEATAFFLYTAVGSGVGATQDAGAINGGATKLFSSFGVGVLEYPIADLVLYGTRCSLKRWYERWSAPAAASEPTDAVAQLLGQLGLGSVEQCLGQLIPDLAEANFCTTAEARKTLLRKGDSDFLAEIQMAMGRIDGALRDAEQQIQEQATTLVNRARSVLRTEIPKWLSAGDAFCRRELAELEGALANLAADNLVAADKRVGLIGSLQKKMVRRAKWIEIIDLLLDRGLRSKQIIDCQTYLELKVCDKLVQALAGVLAEIGNEVTTLRAEVENFARSLRIIATENETEMVRLDEGRARPPFIRQVIPPTRSPRKGKAPAERSEVPRTPGSRRFDVWAAENAVDVPEGIELKSLDVNQALSLLLKPVIDGHQAALGQCDIVRDLRESEELRSELKAVDAAIDPLMRFTEVGPGLAQLHPRKYVAGRLRPNDPLLSHIRAVGGQPQVIESADPYRLVFVVPVHDFEAHVWHGFDQSLLYYQEDEWSFHTLPEHERLPHLAPESAEQGVALKTLGLAFCFDLIHVRGANHYMNLLQRPIEGGTGFCYRYYKAEPNAGAKALIEAKVIQMAPPADVRPGKNDPNLMGASLEEARQRLTGPEAVEFFASIQEIFDDFSSQVGRTRAAEVVRQFVASELNDWIANATRDSKRQSILREMREELNRFAASLH